MEYVGEYKDRLRHGRGSCVFPGGFQYDGEWCRGKMHGQGTFTLPNGATYEGEFVDGEMDGVGLKRWSNGATYSGTFRHGEMDGEGVFMAPNGEKYDGEWRDNQRCGIGEVQLASIGVYKGEFISNKQHGRGVIKYALNGDTYEGDWCLGAREGQGILRSKSGRNLYDGKWRSDMKHGLGTGVVDAVNLDPDVPIEYNGKWENDHPENKTSRLVVKLVSADNDETTDAPAKLVINSKKLPPLAFVCCCTQESPDGQPAQVTGESGRRVVLRIFEDQGPLPMPTTNSESIDSHADGSSPQPPKQWYFAFPCNPTVDIEPHDGGGNVDEGDVEKEVLADENAPLEQKDELRVDSIDGECKTGIAIFRGLTLPAATLPGNYTLICESLASDGLEPVCLPLAVVNEMPAPTNQPPTKGSK